MYRLGIPKYYHAIFFQFCHPLTLFFYYHCSFFVPAHGNWSQWIPNRVQHIVFHCVELYTISKATYCLDIYTRLKAHQWNYYRHLYMQGLIDSNQSDSSCSGSPLLLSADKWVAAGRTRQATNQMEATAHRVWEAGEKRKRERRAEATSLHAACRPGTP